MNYNRLIFNIPKYFNKIVINFILANIMENHLKNIKEHFFNFF